MDEQENQEAVVLVPPSENPDAEAAVRFYAEELAKAIEFAKSKGFIIQPSFELDRLTISATASATE